MRRARHGQLTACGSNKAYRITSEPSGAVVSSGEVIYGTTPFETDLNTILPNRQWDFRFSSSRRLLFEKSGYLPGSATITEFGDGGLVHVELHPERSKEDELRELKHLFDQELISKDDYDRSRSKLLDASKSNSPAPDSRSED